MRELKIKPRRKTNISLNIRPTAEYIVNKKYKFLDEIEELLSSLYEEENYDLVRDNRRFTIKVRYPEIFITNSRGDSHTIKELYMFYTFTFNYNSVGDYFQTSDLDTEGHRGLVSKRENILSYIHSHVSPSNKRYCLGSGFLSDRTTSLYEELSIENIEYFLVAMDIGLAQESVAPEGEPYTYMKDLYVFNENSVDRWTFYKDQVKQVNKCLSDGYHDFMFDNLPLDIVDDSVDFLIINNSLFEQYYENVSKHLTNFILSDDFLEEQEFSCCQHITETSAQKINGEYYRIDSGSQSRNNTLRKNFNPFNFKDTVITPKIEKDNDDNEKNNEKYYIPKPLLWSWLQELCTKAKFVKFYKEELEEDKYEIAE